MLISVNFFQPPKCKINGKFKGNELVEEVINFIARDKKRPICTPLNQE
jgi:hypothetical protein